MAKKIERMEFKAIVKGFRDGRVLMADVGYGGRRGDIQIEFYLDDRKCGVGDPFKVIIKPIKKDKADVAKAF